MSKTAPPSETEALPDTSWPKVRRLAKPVTFAGRSIAEITFQEPTGREWKRWTFKPEGEARITGLLCDLSGLEEGVFDLLPFDDHRYCVSLAESFFDGYVGEEKILLKQLSSSPSFMAGLREMSKG